MAEWTWEPDDFASLWYSDANDRFPRPLHYRSRFPYREEFEAHRHKVINGYSQGEMEQIQLALNTLTTSELRIEILGGTRRTQNGSFGEYRIVGARTEYQAVVLSQVAYDGVDGPIRVVLCRPEHLPSRLVSRLAPVDAGSQPAAVFHKQDLSPNQGIHFEDVARNTPRDRYNRLLGRPGDGGGNAALYEGSILHRPQPLQVLEWVDIRNDGRYTRLSHYDQITVRPAAARDLAAQFTSWIERAAKQARLDEDEYNDW